MHNRDLLARCQATVLTCDTELGWGLSAAACRRYAVALCGLLTEGAPDKLVRDVAVNYHADHALVEALCNTEEPRHYEAWREWMGRALGVLRAKGFGRSEHTLLDAEDLSQVAYAALVRSLPSYRFRSRFSSWAFRVIVQSAQNELRGTRARKRATHPSSLDVLAEHDHPADPRSYDEERAQAQLLSGLVRSVFAAHPDERLGRVFHLWAVEDQRVAEIGERLRLNPSRVRALLREARALLQDNNAIRQWRAAEAADARER